MKVVKFSFKDMSKAFVLSADFCLRCKTNFAETTLEITKGLSLNNNAKFRTFHFLKTCTTYVGFSYKDFLLNCCS